MENLIEQIYHCQILQARGVQLTKPIEELFEPSELLHDPGRPIARGSGIRHRTLSIHAWLHFDVLESSARRTLFTLCCDRNPIERVLAMYNLWRYAYCLNPTIYPAHTGPGFAGTNDFGKFIRSPFFKLIWNIRRTSGAGHVPQLWPGVLTSSVRTLSRA